MKTCPFCGAQYNEKENCWNCMSHAIAVQEKDVPIINKGYDNLPQDVRERLMERYK
jgi:hypothetical protein